MMIFRLFLAAMLATCVARADAAALVLWPIDPKIEANQTATMIWVENRGKDPVTLQIRSLGWGQSGGEDVYSRQDDVVASPPVAKVEAGQKQLVRLIRRTATAADSERSYRLLIDELPPAIEDNQTKAPIAHLSVQMRYSIPLFTYGNAPVQPKLSGRVIVADGKRYVEIHNDGAQHARLVNLRLSRGKQNTAINAGLVGYVLSGATMRWPLSAAPSQGASIVVNVNGSDVVLGSDV